MNNDFNALLTYKDTIESLAQKEGVDAFFAQEVLRFILIVGSLKASCRLSDNENINQRNFTHILGRTLLENFFYLMYIYDNEEEKEERYKKQIINPFKKDYLKLTKDFTLNSTNLLDNMDKAKEEWSNLGNGLNIHDILTQVSHDNSYYKMNYLYFTYRITSFYVHGKSLDAVFHSTFGRENSNFIVLDFEKIFDYISNYYLHILLKQIEL